MALAINLNYWENMCCEGRTAFSVWSLGFGVCGVWGLGLELT